MATRFQWFDGSLGFFGEVEFENYAAVSRSAGRFVLQALDERYDGTWMPHRVVFTITNGEAWYNEAAGQFFYTAGTITGIDYLNAAGETLAEISGLDVSAQVAFTHYNWSNAAQRSSYFWDYVLTNNPNGAAFIGSDETGEQFLDFAAFLAEIELGDEMTTTTGDDTVRGGGGSDYISDYGGSDLFDGQGGDLDLVSYFGWRHMNALPQHGIVADLAAGRVTGPDGNVDTLISIEAISGTIFADVLQGSTADNLFIGRAGSDTIDGRGGFDIAWYDYDSTGGILVDLAKGTVRDGFGGLDRLTSVEGVVGTRLADRFIDTRGAQSFDGGAGDDQFTFGAGNDTATGGVGSDVFRFTGKGFGADVITDFSLSDGDRIHLTGFARFAQVTISDVGEDLLLRAGRAQITLAFMAGETLTAGDFIFG